MDLSEIFEILFNQLERKTKAQPRRNDPQFSSTQTLNKSTENEFCMTKQQQMRCFERDKMIM